MMRINKTIKESSYILILTLKNSKRVMAEDEAKVVAITTEDVEEDGIITVLTGDKEATGHKGEMHPELCVFAVTKQNITSMIVLTVCLSSRRHRRLRIIAHMRLKSGWCMSWSILMKRK